MLIASRYRVVRELGRGGMGAVFLVEHVNTGDHAALKVMLGTGRIDMEALERFKREARAPAKIKSEHVVKVLDADTSPELAGAPFLVMELLSGSDLQKLVRQRGRLGADEVVRFLQEAAIALDKSHALGIIHRDLKPENIYLHKRENGSICVKILDFGISKILPQASASAMPMTALGAVMGTPLFMSPEQARGDVQAIGPQTDVWAIGLIAVHLLTGEHYWGMPRNLTELMTSIIRCDLYPPSTRWPWLPPLFDPWLLRSCARDPAQRFSTVGEQVAALAQALSVTSGIGSTVTDPLGETSAAPSGSGARAMTPMGGGTPPTRPQPHLTPHLTPHFTPPTQGWTPPVAIGSTTAAGAMSGAAPFETRSSGPSVGAGVAVFLAMFLLVGGIGVAAFLFLRSPNKESATAPAKTQTAAPIETQTTDDTPLPALSHKASPPPVIPHAPHTASVQQQAANPPPSIAIVKPAPAKSKHQICVDNCVDGCKSDSDPFECAKPCIVDCP